MTDERQEAMEVIQVTENKKQYLELLLLGDEQEDMIDRYLERGDLFALYDGGLKCICVVTDEGGPGLRCTPHRMGVRPLPGTLRCHTAGYGRQPEDPGIL